MSNLKTARLEPFGVQVDVNLHDLQESDHAELRDLFDCHRLIVVRGQNLTLADQQAFSAIFGKVLHGFEGGF